MMFLPRMRRALETVSGRDSAQRVRPAGIATGMSPAGRPKLHVRS
jgi:hypothetical protein